MSLDVLHLSKRYADRAIVHDVSFRVDDGELVALLGPSGSGKSTILRAIAGLVAVDAGGVVVDGRDVTALPPQARDLGFVFQNYALFEHLSVADNVEFALRVRGVARLRRRQRRDELLDLVGLGGSGRKFPAQLSGGQRQRTALARALAHQPRLLLLDEPFGALDARIRQDLRQGLRELLKRLGTTAVFVTHDQEEAFAVADRIMVLHRGRLLEQGSPERLYRTPRSEFVAGFVGRANLLPGELTARGVRVRLDGEPASADAIPRRVKVLLRPEDLWLDEPGRAPDLSPGQLVCAARVERVEYLGASERVYLDIGGAVPGQGQAPRHRIEALRSAEESGLLPLQPGDPVVVAAKALHPVSQPDLRVLVMAGASAAGRTLVETLLGWGEHSHVQLTLLGGVVGDGLLRQRLDHYRQAFGGDLKLVDSEGLGLDVWSAAAAHLDGERYDLLVIAPDLADADALLPLLRRHDLRHVLLAGLRGAPLSDGGRWTVLLRAFGGAQPDLELPAEVAERANAEIQVRDLYDRPAGPGTPAPPWREALSLRRVPFSVQSDIDGVEAGCAPFDDESELVILDLGSRAGLGRRQRSWIHALAGRWSWLLVQPDEFDLGLGSAAAFAEARLHPLTDPEASRRTPA